MFAECVDHPVILTAVNDIQARTTGLSARIRQRFVVLDTVACRAEDG